MPETATLLVSCPDQKGLVAGISNFIFQNGGNILQSDQYTDIEAGVFLARFEFHLAGFQVPGNQISDRFRPLAQAFAMQYELTFSEHIPRVAMFAYSLPYCLEDLSQRQPDGRAGGGRGGEDCMRSGPGREAPGGSAAAPRALGWPAWRG